MKINKGREELKVTRRPWRGKGTKDGKVRGKRRGRVGRRREGGRSEKTVKTEKVKRVRAGGKVGGREVESGILNYIFSKEETRNVPPPRIRALFFVFTYVPFTLSCFTSPLLSLLFHIPSFSFYFLFSSLPSPSCVPSYLSFVLSLQFNSSFSSIYLSLFILPLIYRTIHSSIYFPSSNLFSNLPYMFTLSFYPSSNFLSVFCLPPLLSHSLLFLFPFLISLFQFTLPPISPPPLPLFQFIFRLTSLSPLSHPVLSSIPRSLLPPFSLQLHPLSYFPSSFLSFILLGLQFVFLLSLIHFTLPLIPLPPLSFSSLSLPPPLFLIPIITPLLLSFSAHLRKNVRQISYLFGFRAEA